ncbi:MAG: hypothetical protein HQM02_00195 [Magnetococcales bacterium]|nr:hypothetical protein [Magnetococcales bacterium]
MSPGGQFLMSPDNGDTGNDLLRGTNASDRYYFNAGDGQDVITDHATNGVNATSNGDAIQFGSGIDVAGIWLEKSAGALNIHYGTGDLVTINNWETGAAEQVEQIRAGDGSLLLNTQVDQLIQSMATFQANHNGISWEQSLTWHGEETRAILAANWQMAA